MPGDTFQQPLSSMQLSPWQYDPRVVLHQYTPLVVQYEPREISELATYLIWLVSLLKLLESTGLESSVKGNTSQLSTFHLIPMGLVFYPLRKQHPQKIPCQRAPQNVCRGDRQRKLMGLRLLQVMKQSEGE